MLRKINVITIVILSIILIIVILSNIFIKRIRNYSDRELLSLYYMNIQTINTWETRAQLYSYLSNYAFASYNCDHRDIDLHNAKIYIDKAIKEDRENAELYSRAALICITLTKQGIACNPRLYLGNGALYLNKSNLDNYLLIAYFYKQIGEHKEVNKIMNEFYIYYNNLEDAKEKERLSKDIDGFGLK